jgi:hypothetical protein
MGIAKLRSAAREPAEKRVDRNLLRLLSDEQVSE